jgi:hypothetical protein
MPQNRSGCPINLTLEALGNRWSLIVIRDLMFGNRRHFRELLTRSEERIASNILADRLTRLAPPRVNDRLWIWRAKSRTAYLRSSAEWPLVGDFVPKADGLKSAPNRTLMSSP